MKKKWTPPAVKQVPDLMEVYEAMYAAFGPQHWWPGETPFEVIIGAILTQNTAWTNVEKAIANLKKAGVLSPDAMRKLAEKELAALIRPAGYFNIKARRIGAFLDYLFGPHGGDLDALFAVGLKRLRHELLEVKGIGPETADSILLYAANLPSFVVDAYTKRIFSRHGCFGDDATYHEVQDYFVKRLPMGVALYNDYHALIVKTGKDYCRPSRPDCERCPLINFF
ncbi:MAG: endonuclease III domain-containing protein [Nitrospirota bacterium]|nr:endonuclease III domain-containing protein [Nitrospirota bacterium]